MKYVNLKKYNFRNIFLCFILFLIISPENLKAEENKNYFSWDFTDTKIEDILYSISLDTGISIVPDDTVEGTGTIKFSGTNFSSAFDSFLNSCRLYVTKENELWTVSKFRCIEHDNLYSLDVYDLYPYEIIDKLSSKVDWVITYDNLPAQKMTVHFKSLSKDLLIKSLFKRFGNYSIKENLAGYDLKQINTRQGIEYSDNSININKHADESIAVDIRDAGFFDVIEVLFKESGTDENFCILGTNDSKVERTVFVGKNFVDTLSKLCIQNNFKYIKDDNIYYFLKDSDSINSLVNGEKQWSQFSLKYTNTDEFLPLLFKKLGNLETISLLDNTSFICNCSSSIKEEINDFIKAVDIKKSLYLVNLKYIKPEDLLHYIPPTINKNNLFIADNNSSLYFKGTEEAYKSLVEQISVIDKPAVKIAYDLLILQFDDNKQNIWSSTISGKKMHSGDRHNLSAVLGSVMGLNLNVVTAFGINFAAELQASLEENSTKVYADTTLHGVSGKKISFQNTNTYRYRDNNLNSQTGKTDYSGVTREIITGIKLDVMGWVSGDGMITSTVTASISRQGVDNSSSTGNPPPTTEKLVTTEVTGKSGEPVVLSGLILNADSDTNKGIPFLSKIPLIGNLFKNKGKTEEKSQMVIFLVPHIESLEKEKDKGSLKSGYKSESWFNEKIKNLEFLIQCKEA